MSQEEVERVHAALPPGDCRLLMVGVLASTAVIQGRRPDRFGGRYPALEAIPRIFTSAPRLVNLLHFRDETKDDQAIVAQLATLSELGGDRVHGFQLNIKWPSPSIIERHRARFPGHRIVLQVGAGAFRAVHQDPESLARRVQQEYTGLIDDILIDPSGGEGKALSMASTRRCLEALRSYISAVGLAVAGGLSAENVEQLVGPLVPAFNDVSIDAEGRLRTPKTDALDVERAVAYVVEAHRTLCPVDGATGLPPS